MHWEKHTHTHTHIYIYVVYSVAGRRIAYSMARPSDHTRPVHTYPLMSTINLVANERRGSQTTLRVCGCGWPGYRISYFLVGYRVCGCGWPGYFLTDGIQSNESTVTAEFVTSLLSSPEHLIAVSPSPLPSVMHSPAPLLPTTNAPSLVQGSSWHRPPAGELLPPSAVAADLPPLEPSWAQPGGHRGEGEAAGWSYRPLRQVKARRSPCPAAERGEVEAPGGRIEEGGKADGAR
jgi:hypothetical protein